MSANRNDAAVKKAALNLAQKLEKACDAMAAYTRACIDAELPLKVGDDGRVLLQESMREFSGHLFAVYDKKGGAA